MELFKFDESFKEVCVCGVDEAGRGPLAGPVVAAAVILKKDAKLVVPEVYDSKKFSEKKRIKIYEKVLIAAEDFGVGIVGADVIDEINILNATLLAMKKAIENLKIKPSLVLVDGNKIPDVSYKAKFIVKGDEKSASIAAASIIAKVKRDEIMINLDEKYKNYFFKNNKGYGTKKHYESILKFGITKEHRKSFLKKIKDKKFKIQKISGELGEKISYKYLVDMGYKVICRNYRCLYGEIDLIAIKEKNICFIEVKLRQSCCGYSPAEAVDLKKQKKIVKSAVCFNLQHPNKFQPKFIVMEVLRNKTGEFFVNFIDNAFYVKDEYELFKD